MKYRKLKATVPMVPQRSGYSGLMGLGAVLLSAVMVSSVFGLSLAGDGDYGDVVLSGGFESDHFGDVWDLTAGDIVITFTYDGTGLVDDAGAHAWSELGVRSLGSNGVDFSPYWRYAYPDVVKKPLFATCQDVVVGEVLFEFNQETGVIYLTYNMFGERLLTSTQTIVVDDLSAVPSTSSGNPMPFKFPYCTDHEPAVTEFTYEIDASAWSGEYRPMLYVVAHAVVVNPDGTVIEGAWASKNDFPDANNWANYFWVKPKTFGGSGVWLSTDYDWTVDTFDPDPEGFPTQDLDDKLILQRKSGEGEGAYDLPHSPVDPMANYRIWWDRDGVDPWQNDETANTGGRYEVEIRLHATSDTTGTAYMRVWGLDQGFEEDDIWGSIECTPAGMTWSGDMHHLLVFYSLYGYGATHEVIFEDILVTQSTT